MKRANKIRKLARMNLGAYKIERVQSGGWHITASKRSGNRAEALRSMYR